MHVADARGEKGLRLSVQGDARRLPRPRPGDGVCPLPPPLTPSARPRRDPRCLSAAAQSADTPFLRPRTSSPVNPTGTSAWISVPRRRRSSPAARHIGGLGRRAPRRTTFVSYCALWLIAFAQRCQSSSSVPGGLSRQTRTCAEMSKFGSSNQTGGASPRKPGEGHCRSLGTRSRRLEIK